jgi:hypothetical protein
MAASEFISATSDENLLKITRFICDGCNKHDAGDLD